jgi:hypothetical protein
VADGCVVADDTFVRAGAQIFRDVVASSRAVAETPHDMPAAAREQPASDFFRRMGAFFGRPVWSRSPAAQ